jgi:hypothetical protein
MRSIPIPNPHHPGLFLHQTREGSFVRKSLLSHNRCGGTLPTFFTLVGKDGREDTPEFYNAIVTLTIFRPIVQFPTHIIHVPAIIIEQKGVSSVNFC